MKTECYICEKKFDLALDSYSRYVGDYPLCGCCVEDYCYLFDDASNETLKTALDTIKKFRKESK